MTAFPQETEFKLWLHPRDVEVFARHPRLRRARPKRQTLHTVYFDTPDFRLANGKVALRVRKTGRRWVQTLKTDDGLSGGLSQRLELETPVTHPRPDFSSFPQELLGRLIPTTIREQLLPVYETRFVRTSWNLRTPHGSRVEVALDVGEIIAGNRRQPLCEVELELKSGNPGALFDLAKVFAKGLMLIPFGLSKAMRGVQLAKGASGKPVKAAAPVLDRMPVCAGFAAILRSDLCQLQANLPGFLLESDPEYCHQARVAIRRFRSAARLFRQDCPLPPRLLKEMAALGESLGRLRDTDVFVLQTLPQLKEHLADEQFSLLLRRAGRLRVRLRDEARHCVRTPATGACLIALEQWLARPDLAAGGGRLGRHADASIKKLQKRVAKGARNVARQSARKRHGLRVSVKRLRYAYEHFSSLLPRQDAFVGNLARLQDELGRMNDVVVAERLAVFLNHDGRLNQAVDALKQWESREARRVLGLLLNSLQFFSRNRPNW